MDEQQPGFFENVQNLTEEYIQDRLLLLKLRAADKSARLAGLLVSFLIIALLAFFVLFFISILVGYFFVWVTQSLFWGFGIVAGFYALLLILVFAFRKKYIEKLIANIVIKVFFDRTADDDEKEN
ncbi:phage holin family protein [Pinibacter aurantiacus]|uniref:Phage holin family protein n=1 Tax=Pinibacter aurantiacus TaxID=2851599 RepID=A0A9E2S8W4_9BACT|nr:phage holin family protein [Pinibacter aurantiacus]MBV4358031.1 phage holin family protein [Pinibacter aurantiacus]